MAQRWTNRDGAVDDRSWIDACVDRYVAQGGQAGRGSADWTRLEAFLHHAVCARLAQDRLLDARGILVEVEDGEVILQGQVRTPSDRRLADLLAYEVHGVHRVLNFLVVQPDLFGEAPAFRSDLGRGVVSLGAEDRAEAQRHPTPRSLPPVIT